MMHFNFMNLAAFISQHPTLTYGAVFLVSVSESLALVGLLVPGTVIMFGVGAVVATGSLRLLPVLVLAAAGAITGDGISYWLGHHYQDSLRRIWPFSRYPAMLQNGEAFFHRHGGKSVLFGRFVGPVRPVIPVVAGMLGMAPLNFAVVNFLSAVGWALAYILPGVLFGSSLAVAGAVSSRLAILLLLAVVSCWLFVSLGRRLLLLAARRGPGWLEMLKEWSGTEASVFWPLRPVKKIIIYLFRNQGGEEWFVGLMALAIITAVWGFLGILQDVMARDPLVLTDQAVYHFFQSLRTPWADQIMVAVTELGDAFVNIALTGSVLLVLLIRRCYRAAVFLFLAMVGGSLLVLALKWLIHLPRPVAIYHGAAAYGFPSGHTTMSVVLYGFLAILMARGLAGVWRWGLVVSALLFSFIIAFSRLYLGAHWLSDVLGGFFLGISWAAFLGIAYHRKPDAAMPRRLLMLVVILIVISAGGWHVRERHAMDLALYAPRHRAETMSRSVWQKAGWRTLPAWRIDMAGEREQPLTIQWAATAVDVRRYLSGRGWRQPLLGVKNILGIFAPNTPLIDLPVLPHLQNGRAEVLLLIRRDGNRRLLLRLWPSDIMIDGNTPLWVGTIESQSRRHLTGLITLALADNTYSPATFVKDINMFDSRLVRRKRRHYEWGGHERVVWQGRVLLIWAKE